MTSRQLDEESIFHVAREISNLKARAEYLDQICSGDQALRERVEALLEVHEKEQSFLKSNTNLEPTADHTPVPASAGQQIGRYKLMEQIGEGGMGSVFVAQQERPLRRKVALKVIKPGMDSKAVIARFEAERQALAVMDHPNIAKVLDAGTTDSGRPYFVMELVRGLPITEYCDKQKLTITERLELFIQVCQAIQHAHQKAIIHRDIKPSNVLVTEQDGKAVPKVIDFGVAKALNQSLTDRTIYTSFAQIVGTPLYMSPEQAALSAVDVDTRSDVYSLGVLLYELLTGSTPFERHRFEQAAFDEIRRIVREEEPPKPSTKISTFCEHSNAVALNRRTEHEKLSRDVRGELDWIVMKSIEKDRGRRYESPTSLVDDIERLLNNQPVEACPPSSKYLLKKFVRRNRMLITTTSVVVVVLITSTATSSWFAWQMWVANETAGVALADAKRERQIAGVALADAERERQIAGVALADAENERQIALDALHDWRYELIDRGIESALRGDALAVHENLRKAKNADVPEQWQLLIEGLGHQFGGEPNKARLCLTRAWKLYPESVAIKSTLAMSVITREIDQELYHTLMLELQEPVVGEYADYDWLLSGWSLIYVDPAKALKLMEKSSERPWPVRKAMIAQAKAHHALDVRDSELAREAIDLVRDAEKTAGGNPFVQVIGIFARSVGIALSDDTEQLEIEGDALAQLLREKPQYWQGMPALSHYYFVRGHEDTSAFFRTLDEDWAGACRAGYFLEHDDIAASLEGLDEHMQRTPLATIAQACVLARIGKTDRAMQIFNKISVHRSWMVRVSAIEILLHLGKSEDAKSHARDLLEQIDGVYDGPFISLKLRLQTIVEDLNEKELDEAVGDSNIGRCYQEYLMGLMKFAKHDARASEHFRAAISTVQFNLPQYYMARAMLARAEKTITPPQGGALK